MKIKFAILADIGQEINDVAWIEIYDQNGKGLLSITDKGLINRNEENLEAIVKLERMVPVFHFYAPNKKNPQLNK